MKYSLFRSLRTQLLLLVLISVLPALVIILYSGLAIQQKDIARAESDALRVVNSLDDDHERIVDSTRQFLAALAKFPDVQKQNVKACNRLFGELLKENPLYANIFAATAEGMVFSNARPSKPHSIRERKYYQDSLRTGDFSVGEYVIGVTLKQPVLHYAYPVRDTGGEFKGIVVVAFALNRYGHILSMGELPPGSRLTLTDHKSRVIYRYPHPEKFMGEVDKPDLIKAMSSQINEGTFTGFGNDGTKCLYGYKRFYLKGNTSPYLFLRVGIPEEQALRYARNSLVVNLALLGGAFLIAMVLAWFLGRRLIVQRLRRLVDAAQRLGHGDLQIRTGLSYSQDELGLLTKAFDEMAEALEDKETQRKSVEGALRKNEEKFKAIADYTYDWENWVGTDGKLVWVNSGVERMTGYSVEECMSMTDFPFPIIDEADRGKVAEGFGKALQGERRGNFEFRLRCKDGALRWGSVAYQPIYDDSGNSLGHRSSIRDITERKQAEGEKAKLQEQLLQAQKMESVGRLAGGVAHDFNNMLGVILGHVEMAVEHVDKALPLHTDLQEIRKAAQRSADLTQQLLTFARKQTVSPKVLDMNATVAAILKMLQRLIGEDIHLIWLPGLKLWPVKIDPSQIDQILANMCVNARDAISGVGKVTIETGNVFFDEAYCADHAGYVPGEYVLLAVSDDGCGMSKETFGNLFEPFFTTKERGKGTGLGLATIYGIVKQNSGFINVYSEPGQGTTFKIYLPRHIGKTEQVQTVKPQGPQEPIMRGRETVLVVEDEPAILSLSKRMLEKQGYQVLIAGTPGEATRVAEEHTGEIHLLMTDVVMPEMNGRDLAEKLLSLYPNLKCLFMSGYTADVIAHHGVLDDEVHFIQKPFSIKDMAAKVREVLDRN